MLLVKSRTVKSFKMTSRPTPETLFLRHGCMGRCLFNSKIVMMSHNCSSLDARTKRYVARVHALTSPEKHAEFPTRTIPPTPTATFRAFVAADTILRRDTG